MATFTYNNDIPDAPNNPSADQPLMKTNTNSIDSIIDVDHFSFEDAGRDGTHKLIHMPTPQGVGTSPATGATEWDYYTKTLASGSVETFWKRPNVGANTGDIQMSMNVNPSVTGTKGVTFLPGGFRMAFGYITGAPITNGTPVTYGTTFTANIYSLVITGQTASTSDKTINVLSPNNSLTGFTVITSGSSNFTALSWVAIGD